jgi:hypothetical protein
MGKLRRINHFRHDKFLLFLISSGSVYIFYTVARFDPNPHHDGYIFATSLSWVADLNQLGPVFNQYGPLTSWFYSIFLSYLPNTLLTLRLVNAVLLVLIIILVYLIGERLSKPSVSFLGTSIVVLSQPIFTYSKIGFINSWPWPSVLSLFFICLGVFLWIKASPDSEDRRLVLQITSGASIGMALLIRNSVGALGFVLLILFFLVLYFTKSNPKRYRYFAVGLLSIFVLFFILLVAMGMLQSYVNDTLIGAINKENLPSLSLFTSMKNIFYAPIAFFLLLIAFVFIETFFRRISLVFVGILLSLLVAANIFLVLIKSGSREELLLLPDSLYFSFSLIISHLSLLFIPAIIINFLITAFRSEAALKFEILNRVFILLLSFIPYFQLFPLGDIQHLWWASPLGTVLTFIHVFKEKQFQSIRNFFVHSSLFSLTIGLLLFCNYSSLPRLSVEDTSIFSGLKIQTKYFENYQYVTQALQGLPIQSTLIRCEDAAVSVWNREYLSSSPNFVDWGWSITKLNEMPTNFLVLCTNSYSEGDVFAKSNPVEMLSRPPDSYTGYFDGMQWNNYKRQFVYVYKFKPL